MLCSVTRGSGRMKPLLARAMSYTAAAVAAEQALPAGFGAARLHLRNAALRMALRATDADEADTSAARTASLRELHGEAARSHTVLMWCSRLQLASETLLGTATMELRRLQFAVVKAHGTSPSTGEAGGHLRPQAPTGRTFGNERVATEPVRGDPAETDNDDDDSGPPGAAPSQASRVRPIPRPRRALDTRAPAPTKQSGRRLAGPHRTRRRRSRRKASRRARGQPIGASANQSSNPQSSNIQLRATSRPDRGGGSPNHSIDEPHLTSGTEGGK